MRLLAARPFVSSAGRVYHIPEWPVLEEWSCGSTHLSVLAAFASALILTSYAATESRATAAPVPASPRITVLYDAFGNDSTMTKDWGYAALVEISGKRILFDTGDDPEILAKNAKAKGVDLTKLDFVVLSHRHGDHIGGFPFYTKRESES